MKKAMLWVKILAAGAAAGGAIHMAIRTAEQLRIGAGLSAGALLDWSFALFPALFVLIYALGNRQNLVLAAAAIIASAPCFIALWDRVDELARQMDRTAPPRGAVGILEWVIQGSGILLQLAGLILFLWVAADSLRGLKGLKVSRTLVSVWAGMQGIRCIVYIWDTAVSLTDPREAAAGVVPSGLLLASNLSGILAVLCFTAAWTVLVWGGLKREQKDF